MGMSDADVAFVDLIEEQPLDLEAFVAKEVGEDRVDAALKYDREFFESEHAEYVAAHQPWRIVIAAHNGEPLFRSTERYKDERDARRAIDIAFGANTNVWLRQEGKERVAVRVAWRG